MLACCNTVSVVSYLPKFTETPLTGVPPVRHIQVGWPTLRYRYAEQPAEGSRAVGYCAEAAVTDCMDAVEMSSSLYDFCATAERAKVSNTNG